VFGDICRNTSPMARAFTCFEVALAPFSSRIGNPKREQAAAFNEKTYA